MGLHVFLALLAKLRSISGVADSIYITLEEQAAIFLYTCVTGLPIHHVREQFQPSNETILKYITAFLLHASSS
jgi:hypothetical protein